jgi:hypothetical protein
MRNLVFVALFLFPLGAGAEKHGNWEYFIPEASPFSLNPTENGLYIEFLGQITFEAQIVASFNENGDAYNLVAKPPEEVVQLLPYRKIGVIQRPRYIQLLENKEFLSSLNSTIEDKIVNSDVIVGVAEITIKDLKSSADCGVASFFVFNNSISKFKHNEKYKGVQTFGC